MASITATGATQGSAILEALSGAQTKKDGTALSSENRFLTLLTTQLKNQDPLNPMDNAQMTSQLAQISTVDGIEKLNATLQSLVDNSTDSEALQAAALVGHGVMVPGSGLSLQEGTALGGVELTDAADRVRVTIKDGNGLAIRTSISVPRTRAATCSSGTARRIAACRRRTAPIPSPSTRCAATPR